MFSQFCDIFFTNKMNNVTWLLRNYLLNHKYLLIFFFSMSKLIKPQMKALTLANPDTREICLLQRVILLQMPRQ